MGMDATHFAQLEKELRRDEGVRYEVYLDSVGLKTVGVGHNIDAKPLPSYCSLPLTDLMVDRLLSDDLCNVFADLDRALSWWRTLDGVRQRVIANMDFNLGISGLLEFKLTLAAIKAGQYDTASREMLDSAWAKQVGDRADRLASMMKTGVTA
jgi:lysozyme